MPTTSRHTVTANGQEYVVESEWAPGAHLLDQSCTHGMPFDHVRNLTDCQKAWHPFVSEFMMSLSSLPGRLPNVPIALEFWAASPHRMSVFQKDAVNHELPRTFFSAAVAGSCMEQGGADYSRVALLGYITSKYFQDNPHRTESSDWVKDLQATISRFATDDGLYAFLHDPEYRQCMCMQYVAAASASGNYCDEADMVTLNCGHCHKLTNGLKRCGRCKVVLYCNATCQKSAWKSHKQKCFSPKS